MRIERYILPTHKTAQCRWNSHILEEGSFVIRIQNKKETIYMCPKHARKAIKHFLLIQEELSNEEK